MARFIKFDGVETKVTPSKGNRWTLKELQKHVDGDIELLPGVKERIVVNENGRLKSLPLNLKATVFYQDLLKADGRPLRYLPELRGNILILEEGEKM